jgi:hypothetical protein
LKAHLLAAKCEERFQFIHQATQTHRKTIERCFLVNGIPAPLDLAERDLST